jgi:hypothetical protein
VVAARDAPLSLLMVPSTGAAEISTATPAFWSARMLDTHAALAKLGKSEVHCQTKFGFMPW